MMGASDVSGRIRSSWTSAQWMGWASRRVQMLFSQLSFTLTDVSSGSR
jgi:hypothetical protein